MAVTKELALWPDVASVDVQFDAPVVAGAPSYRVTIELTTRAALDRLLAALGTFPARTAGEEVQAAVGELPAPRLALRRVRYVDLEG